MRWINGGRKKGTRWWLGPMTAAVAAIIALPVHAEIGPYLGLEGGWSNPLDANVDASATVNGATTSGGGRFRFHEGLVGGATAGYALPGHLRPELEVNYRRNTIHDADGAVSAIAMMGNLWYDFEERYTYFYLGGGIGELHLKLSGNITGTQQDSDSDNVFAYQFGAGAGFFITPQLSIGVDYRYLTAAQKATFDYGPYATANGPLTTRARLRYRGQTVMIGVRYNFGLLWNPLNVSNPQAPVRVVPLDTGN